MAFVRHHLVLVLVGLGASPALAQQNPYFMSPPQNVYQNLQSATARAQNPWLNGGASNPYTPYNTVSPSSVVATNPYVPVPFDPFFNPFTNPFFGIGSAAYGQAEQLRAYGQVMMNQEQSRVIREQAMQAKIDTARKRFDFDLYVRANTPTFADDQKKIARNTLQRIQISSNPMEILSGKALNILLDDVRKHPLKKANMDPIPMSQDVLEQLNVTTGTDGVGMLRHQGKFTWPTALADILPIDQQRAIEKQVQLAVANASAGKIDRNVFDDLNLRMDDLKKQLVQRVNDIPPGQYLQADRFLTDFRQSRRGVEEGQMAVQVKFNGFIQGGKTIQEVADYLVANGLRFAPATVTGEAGYRAMHSALVAFDIALNTNTPAVTAEAKDAPPQP